MEGGARESASPSPAFAQVTDSCQADEIHLPAVAEMAPPAAPGPPEAPNSMKHKDGRALDNIDGLIQRILSKTAQLEAGNIESTLLEALEDFAEVRDKIPSRNKQLAMALDGLLHASSDLCKNENNLRAFMRACPKLMIKGCHFQEHLSWLEGIVDKSCASPFTMDFSPIGDAVENVCCSWIADVQPAPNRLLHVENTRARLEDALRQRFDGAQLHIFGSCAGDIYTKSSDIDLYMELMDAEASFFWKDKFAASKAALRKAEKMWANIAGLLSEKERLDRLSKDLQGAVTHDETLAQRAKAALDKAIAEMAALNAQTDELQKEDNAEAKSAISALEKTKDRHGPTIRQARRNWKKKEAKLKDTTLKEVNWGRKSNVRMREIDALLLSEEGQRGQQELAQAQQALRVAELALSLETRVLYHVADCFLSSGFKNVQTIALARVPVVKLEDPVHGFEVDICLNNRIAACNTALLRTYLRMDDRIRDVVFLVKAWTKARCISDSAGGSLSSYGWVILVIHFFQQIGLLPNLQGEEAIALLNAPRTVCDNIDVTFLEDCVLGKEKLPRKQVSCAGSLPTASVAKLFREFLAYYATSFDWIRSVASIHSPNFAVRSKVDAMGPKCGVLQLKILSRLLTRRVPMTWAALSTKRGH